MKMPRILQFIAVYSFNVCLLCPSLAGSRLSDTRVHVEYVNIDLHTLHGLQWSVCLP